MGKLKEEHELDEQLRKYKRKLDDEIRMLAFLLMNVERFPQNHKDRSPNEIRWQIERLKLIRDYTFSSKE